MKNDPKEMRARREQLEDDYGGAAVASLLMFMGEDPSRDGLKETPWRVARAFRELTSGYEQDPAEILTTRFENEEEYDQMILVTGIDFVSLCEHHLMAFTGTATVGYIPDGEVVGLSKIPRLVECFARRLQIQERMTQQICQTLWKELEPQGVGVIVRAHHSCMGCRGVKQREAEMVTSALSGVFLEKPEVRSEFLALVGSGRRRG